MGDASAGGSQSAFVRQTTKYWVSLSFLPHSDRSTLGIAPLEARGAELMLNDIVHRCTKTTGFN